MKTFGRLGVVGRIIGRELSTHERTTANEVRSACCALPKNGKQNLLFMQ